MSKVYSSEKEDGQDCAKTISFFDFQEKAEAKNGESPQLRKKKMSNASDPKKDKENVNVNFPTKKDVKEEKKDPMKELTKDKKMDYYKLLGVDKGDSEKVIRKAY